MLIGLGEAVYYAGIADNGRGSPVGNSRPAANDNHGTPFHVVQPLRKGSHAELTNIWPVDDAFLTKICLISEHVKKIADASDCLMHNAYLAPVAYGPWAI